MLRVARAVSSSRAPLACARRAASHQDNSADDPTWTEADREMTAEARYAFAKQQELLKQHVDEINAKFAAHHQETRDVVEMQMNQSAAAIASLEAQIVELSNALEQLKAEQAAREKTENESKENKENKENKEE